MEENGGSPNSIDEALEKIAAGRAKAPEEEQEQPQEEARPLDAAPEGMGDSAADDTAAEQPFEAESAAEDTDAVSEVVPQEEGLVETPDTTELSKEELLAIVEVLLLVSDKPLPVSRIQDVLDGVDKKAIKEIVGEIQQKLTDNGFPYQIREIAGGYVLSTLPEYAPWIRKFYAPKTKTSKLSQAALETLAVIAYKQPVTRGEIEAVRGVSVDSTLKTLLEKRFAEIVGYKDVVGKPATYGTTNEFLLQFGLKDVSELPTIEELRTNPDQ